MKLIIYRLIILLIALNANAWAADMKRISNNIGLLPTDLGPAKLQKSQHTFLHYFQLKSLLKESDEIKDRFINITKTIDNLY